MTPDFKRHYLLAQLSAVAYDVSEDLARRAVEELGLKFVGLVRTPGFQALVCRELDGGQIVAFRGTPVTCARDIADWVESVTEDLDAKHVNLGNGALIVASLHGILRNNVQAVVALLDPAQPVTFTGHSLGGAQALAAPAYIDRAFRVEVIVFAPFQFANGAFFVATYSGRLAPVVVGRRADFALGWDHADRITVQYVPVLHLTGPGYELLNRWPWFDDSVSDHAVEEYVEDLRGLANAQGVIA